MVRVRRLVGLALLAATVGVASGCSLMGREEEPVSERAVVASHILYSPHDDAAAAVELPLSDPGWSAAEDEARTADQTLRAIADPTERAAAFVELAATASDDTVTGEHGGSLGPFFRRTMVSAFADPVFDAPSPEPGDIIGPVRTEFGWHVIMYEGEGDPADVEER